LVSLKKKSILGLIWSSFDIIFSNGVTFITGIILARILLPSEFGLIGIVTIILALASILIDGGFSVGLIRKIECTKDEYNSVFYFNLFMSLLLYIIIFIIAPLISNYFGETQLTLIIRVFSIIIVIDSVAIIHRILIFRKIDFKLKTKISLISSIASSISGITFALNGYGVWSLVFQVMINKLFNSILFWYYVHWHPSLTISISRFKKLLIFSSKMLLTDIIITVQNQIYYIIIGHYFSIAQVGFYNRAEQFNAIVVGNLTGIIDRVFFPVLASMQENNEILKQNLRKVFKSSFLITYSALLFLVSTAKPLILILIGEKWSESILYLQLIALGSVFFPVNALNSNILKIKGRSDYILRLQIIKTILLIPVIFTGIFWGIIAMLISRIVHSLISTFMNSMYSSRIINYSLLEQYSDILPYFKSISFISLIICAISYVQYNPILILLIQLIIGTVLFFSIFEFKKYDEYIEIKTIIKSKLATKS
jgi:O-antigen/teichoic acid export membrane protein